MSPGPPRPTDSIRLRRLTTLHVLTRRFYSTPDVHMALSNPAPIRNLNHHHPAQNPKSNQTSTAPPPCPNPHPQLYPCPQPHLHHSPTHPTPTPPPFHPCRSSPPVCISRGRRRTRVLGSRAAAAGCTAPSPPSRHTSANINRLPDSLSPILTIRLLALATAYTSVIHVSGR